MDCEMHRALAIPEIREHILQFCSKKDLKACRYVCKSWRDSSVNAWSSKTSIKLTDGIKMSEFLGFLVSTGATPKLYANFCLSFSLEHHKTANELWRICGDNVKNLELSRCEFRSADDLRAVLFQLCPNMEKLSLDHVCVVGTDKHPVREPVKWAEPKFGVHGILKSLTVDHRASKNTGISWMEYFSHFSSLQVLRMQREREGDPDMFRTVAIIRAQDPTKLNLKQLRIYYHNTSRMNPARDLLSVLLDPGLQFQSLVLCVNRELAQKMNERTAFRDILDAHRASLKTFELNCRFRDMLNASQQPFYAQLDNFSGQFENLDQVTLMATSITSLNFLKYTPNLSRLLLKYDMRKSVWKAIPNTDLDDLADVVLPKLETLELNLDRYPSKNWFRRLIRLMPNVKKLKARLYNNLFHVVCKGWASLETLEIVRGEVNCSGITGLDKDQEDFCDRNRSCTPPTDMIPVWATITCLQQLRTLSMEGNGRVLSHWAAHMGIERLPHLEHLRLQKYDLECPCGIWKSLLERYPWPKCGTRW